MRLYSTPESVDKGDISIFAVVETILATAIAIYLSVKLNSFKWIAWTACIAPFLLLRTEYSTAHGIKFLDDLKRSFSRRILRLFEDVECERDQRHQPRVPSESMRGGPASSGSKLHWNLVKVLDRLLRGRQLDFHKSTARLNAMFWLLPFTMAIRFLTIFLACCRHPLISFSSIPANWSRAALCQDICCPPEMVPGYHTKGVHVSLKLAGFIRDFFQASAFFRDDPFTLVSKWTCLLVLIVLLFLPSLLYRWSMKATAIVYTPLLWIVWSTFRKMPDLSAALKRIRMSDLTRVVVLYSILVIAGCTAKFILMVTWSQFAAWWNTNPVADFLAVYVAPTEIPVWQLAAFINAFLAIGIFAFVKEALMRVDSPEAWSPRGVEATLRISSFVRCLLTLYILACTGYVTVQAATSWSLPRLGTKLFPWMN